MLRKASKKVCARCGAHFEAPAGGSKYCSPACYIDSNITKQEDGCWTLNGSVQVKVDGVKRSIVHILWEQAGGLPIPKTGRAWLEKTCTGEGCVNPAHRKRVQQRVVRDFFRGGVGFGTCNLTVREIKEIRMNRWSTTKELATRYCTTQRMINGIREGRLHPEIVITGADWK